MWEEGFFIKIPYARTHIQAYEEYRCETQAPRPGRCNYVVPHLSRDISHIIPPRSAKKPTVKKTRDGQCPQDRMVTSGLMGPWYSAFISEVILINLERQSVFNACIIKANILFWHFAIFKILLI